MKWFKRKPKQYVFVYCQCGVELESTEALSDWDEARGIATYTCGGCSEETRFLFDAPAPIRLPAGIR